MSAWQNLQWAERRLEAFGRRNSTRMLLLMSDRAFETYAADLRRLQSEVTEAQLAYVSARREEIRHTDIA